MTSSEIYQELQRTLVVDFEVAEESISLEANLFEDLGLDSLDALDMATRLEEMTGKRVSEGEIKALKTVSEVVNLCMQQEQVHAEVRPDPAL